MHYIIHENLSDFSVSSETTKQFPNQLPQLHQFYFKWVKLQQQGKMHLHLIFIAIGFTLMHKILATTIMPELKKNVLNFRYSANFKYEGMLAHSFDRFYVVTKFEMPKIEDLKLNTFTFDLACSHLISDKTFMQKYLKNCQRIVPYVRFYQKQIEYYNWTANNMLQNEIGLILPTFTNGKRKKRFISAVLGTVALKIIGLAFEGISSFLHQKRHKALHKAVKQINERKDMEHNRVYHLEDYYGNVW